MTNENDINWDDFFEVMDVLEKDICGNYLRWVSKGLRNNAMIVYTSVKNRGIALKYASSRLRNNFEIAYSAVKQNGWALEFVSPKVRTNIDIVLAAVKDYGPALRLASTDITSPCLVTVGCNSRNYYFGAIREEVNSPWRVKAGCRDYTVEEAVKHWGPEGKSDRPDCYDLVLKIIEKIKIAEPME